MKPSFSFFAIGLLLVSSAHANYTSPGNGSKLTLANLVASSNGDVSFTLDAYQVNDTVTISVNDTLAIGSNATVKFAAGTFLEINGTVIINPPTGVLFTAQNTGSGYLGMRLNIGSASTLKKLTFEYAVSLRLTDCSPVIDSCTFQYNNNSASTTFGNAAITLFRSSPVISNCKFLSNQRAAIQGGANISNAPKILNCLFMDNNTTNQNVPQINLGATGTDTAKILNNQILRASTRSGGIGFLPIGDVYAVISGNVIKNNRYGITFNGGANIHSLVSYNVIDSNNTEGNPLLGGSGIAFSGGSATSHQSSVVTGNYIRGNLWGITIGPTSTGGGAMPNLGNLLNSDTADDGKNRIYGNTNTTTPNIELYNNNVDNITAQNNYWGSDDPAIIEAGIFHGPDNPSLGTVNYSNYITLPTGLISFNASVAGNDIALVWQTSFENNSEHFSVEKSGDGQRFYAIGNVRAAGQSSVAKMYDFTDKNASKGKWFYRLKLVDKDGRFRYSNVVSIGARKNEPYRVEIHPTAFTASQNLTVQIISPRAQTFTFRFLSAEGRELKRFFQKIVAGTNTFSVQPDGSLASGVILINCTGDEINKTVTLFKY